MVRIVDIPFSLSRYDSFAGVGWHSWDFVKLVLIQSGSLSSAGVILSSTALQHHPLERFSMVHRPQICFQHKLENMVFFHSGLYSEHLEICETLNLTSVCVGPQTTWWYVQFKFANILQQKFACVTWQRFKRQISSASFEVWQTWTYSLRSDACWFSHL